MERTVFLIRNMDCPSEEQMIRMKLSNNKTIKRLDFDIEKRRLVVMHEGGLEAIAAAIHSLSLGEEIVETAAHTGDTSPEDHSADKKLLLKVLLINFSVFVIEVIAGIVANSMGLVADSLDELADAFVYALSIFAISGTLAIKKRIARFSAVLQLALALWGFVEVVRRFIGDEPMPNFAVMIIISFIALIGNFASLYFLRKSKSQEVHIKATQIFTSNDVMVNIGVIAAAILVAILQSKIPDLIVGSIVFAIVFKGAIKIFKLAK